jgi:hypothetical protein
VKPGEKPTAKRHNSLGELNIPHVVARPQYGLLGSGCRADLPDSYSRRR